MLKVSNYWKHVHQSVNMGEIHHSANNRKIILAASMQKSKHSRHKYQATKGFQHMHYSHPCRPSLVCRLQDQIEQMVKSATLRSPVECMIFGSCLQGVCYSVVQFVLKNITISLIKIIVRYRSSLHVMQNQLLLDHISINMGYRQARRHQIMKQNGMKLNLSSASKI